jgi:hypothetical protein
MTRCLRAGFFIVVAAFAGLVLHGHPSRLEAGGKKDYEYRITFEPKTPVLGDNYNMYIRVWNNDPTYAMIFRATILKLPDGDKLLGARTLEQRVPPGASHVFRFDIFCGTEEGQVTYDLSAAWEE